MYFSSLFSYIIIIIIIVTITTATTLTPSSVPPRTGAIAPNFTATYLQFINNSGAFLFSENSLFMAALHNPFSSSSNGNYFSVIHFPSNAIIWTANRHRPVSFDAALSLIPAGLSLSDTWSTPQLPSPVSSLRLLDSGDLVLLGGPKNATLWRSFDHPTDSLVTGQRLPAGLRLVSSADISDFSAGSYSLAVRAREGLVLEWLGRTYWKLGLNSNSTSNLTQAFSHVEMNGTGLFLFGVSGTAIAGISFGFSGFRIAQVGYGGRLTVKSFIQGVLTEEFKAPVDYCEVPLSCGTIGLCVSYGEGRRYSICECPDEFVLDLDSQTHSCVPRDDSLSLPRSCERQHFGSPLNVSYAKLSVGVGYFANDFLKPAMRGVNFSSCRDFCTRNCSCWGVFYGNLSGSCFVLDGQLGSLRSNGPKEPLGYIKTVVRLSSSATKERKSLPKAKLVLILTLMASFVLVMTILVITILWRNKKSSSRTVIADGLQRGNSSSSAEIEMFNLPGLPKRFNYVELVEATKDFSSQIGSGGFGIVYKGTMKDGANVAVKKINELGVRGNREFSAETAVIGSVRHANLVRLRGFCIHRERHFLVYEFMSRGSLEKILFNGGDGHPILEWQDRFKIALGTARALAYLHSGCQKKIIHCDIKPENILLNDNFQVKVSDFGLSKLLDHESSKLVTTLRGTWGYLAPEWLTGIGITDKSDVYSYGMVLLEILSGRRNSSFVTREGDNIGEGNCGALSYSSAEHGTAFFPSVALEMHKERRYLELVDPRLEGRVSEDEIEMIVKIALCCVHIVPVLRPSMDKVVSILEGRVGLCEPRLEVLHFLQSYGGRY